MLSLYLWQKCFHLCSRAVKRKTSSVVQAPAHCKLLCQLPRWTFAIENKAVKIFWFWNLSTDSFSKRQCPSVQHGQWGESCHVDASDYHVYLGYNVVHVCSSLFPVVVLLAVLLRSSLSHTWSNILLEKRERGHVTSEFKRRTQENAQENNHHHSSLKMKIELYLKYCSPNFVLFAPKAVPYTIITNISPAYKTAFFQNCQKYVYPNSKSVDSLLMMRIGEWGKGSWSWCYQYQ